MRTLETAQPISQSKIWQLTANYYLNKGPSAWTNDETPSFATSSCYIAHYYAQIIIHAMLDWQNKSNKESHFSTIFYILELSSGLGEFAFHCVKQLSQLKQVHQLDHIKFCYILTDLVEQNIASWQEGGAFLPYVDRGEVDFACYDLTKPSVLKLIHTNISLDAKQLVNPLIVIANYIFDSVPSDMFYVTGNQLKQGVISLQVPKNMDLEKPEDLSQINSEVNLKPINEGVYPEPLYNEIINSYRYRLNGAMVNFPISALRYLQFLLEISHGNMLLLSADKGYATEEMIKQVDRFHIDFHYSLSILVNFHAIEQFFLQHQGDSFYQDRFTQLVTAVYISGMKFQEMPNLQHFLKNYQNEISPLEYCRLIYQLSSAKSFEPQSLLAIFRLSKYDPIVLRLFRQPILQLSNPYKVYFNKQLREIFEKIQNNIYPQRRTAELDFTLGCVYHMLGDYHLALEFLNNYKPTQFTAYEYYQRLKECYQHLDEEGEARKIKPLLRAAKISHWFRGKKNFLISLSRKLQFVMRYLLFLIGLLIIFYFLIQLILK